MHQNHQVQKHERKRRLNVLWTSRDVFAWRNIYHVECAFIVSDNVIARFRFWSGSKHQTMITMRLIHFHITNEPIEHSWGRKSLADICEFKMKSILFHRWKPPLHNSSIHLQVTFAKTYLLSFILSHSIQSTWTRKKQKEKLRNALHLWLVAIDG